MPSSLSRDQLLRLARHGARARVAELREEIAAIERAFPELKQQDAQRRPERTEQARPQTASASDRTAPSSSKQRTRGWTPAQRKAAAARMKAYWAKQRGK